MNDVDIATYIMISEPVFEIGDKQYSVCCPKSGLFCTWDSDGNTFDFRGIAELLNHWMIDGRPFREIVNSIM